MRAVSKVVTILVLTALLGMSGLPAYAASLDGAPAGFLALHGEQLSDEDLAQIEGKGFVSGLVGAGAGALAGLVTYTVEVAWDTYVNGEDWSWEASEASKAVVTGAAGGFVAGFFAPSL